MKKKSKLKKIWIQPTSMRFDSPGLMGCANYMAQIYNYPRPGCIELTVGKVVPREGYGEKVLGKLAVRSER